MNITRHARERWEQRVNPKAGEDVEDQIRKAFENADYVWYAEHPDRGIQLYYINSDHWVFVVDEQKRNIVTVFEIDYGFPKDINRTVVRELLAKIAALRPEVDRVRMESNEYVAEVEGRINVLEAERGQLINQINIIDSKIKRLKEEARTAEMQVTNIEYEVEKLLHQLIYKGPEMRGKASK